MLKRHSINSEIAAYESMQEELEEKYKDQWVLFHQAQLVSVYESFDDAAKDAMTRFRRGPYLIRQVGAPVVTLPAWVTFCPGFNEVISSCPFGVISITQGAHSNLNSIVPA